MSFLILALSLDPARAASLTIADLVPGDLVITEIMQNPSQVTDNYGEWFEVCNESGLNIQLRGLRGYDLGGSSFTVSRYLRVVAGDCVVFGRSRNTSLNGGVTVDFKVPSSFWLGNSSDEIYLSNGTTVLDSVAWDNGASFPDPLGSSMSLDPGATSVADNDDGSSWCEAQSTYGLGDYGTPGTANDDCDAVCFDGVTSISIDGNSPHDYSRLAAADLDGDGALDLVAAHGYRNVGVALNNGDGTFASEVVYAIAGASSNVGATNIEIADLDGDGVPDLIIPIYGPWNGNTVEILYGYGDGSFGNATEIHTTAENPMAASAADMDGDGDLDLAISHNNGGWYLDIALQDSNGTFAVAYTHGAGQNPQYLAESDLDGDGWTDLVAGVNYNGVYVFRNAADGSGNVESPDTYLSRSWEYVTVADVDLDGFDDVVVGSYWTAAVTILFNDGLGGFSSSSTVTTEGIDGYPAVGEFNGDGLPDLAFPNQSTDTVSIFLGDGTGGFTAYDSIALDDRPQMVIAADLDGDGRDEVVVSYIEGDHIDILWDSCGG